MCTLPRAGSTLRGITQEPCACSIHPCPGPPSRVLLPPQAPTPGPPAPIRARPGSPVPTAYTHPKANSSRWGTAWGEEMGAGTRWGSTHGWGLHGVRERASGRAWLG